MAVSLKRRAEHLKKHSVYFYILTEVLECVYLCAVCALLMSGRAICRPGTVQLVEHWKILYCFSCIERRRHRASAL